MTLTESFTKALQDNPGATRIEAETPSLGPGDEFNFYAEALTFATQFPGASVTSIALDQSDLYTITNATPMHLP